MPRFMRYGVSGVLLAILLLIPLAYQPAAAQEGGINADLYFLARDQAQITEVWRINRSNELQQVTTETSDILAFDVSFNNSIAYITGRSLVISGFPVTSGGPLDSASLQLNDVAWSPGATQVAVVAVAPEGADPSEGVWTYDINAQTWTPVLTTTKSDPNNMLVYKEVDWASSGDRLVLQLDFSETTSGIAIYSLSTGRNLTLNQAGTDNIIDPNGYGRGSLSLDGARVVLSDVPESPTGTGFIVDVNNITRIVPLADPGARYLSHAIPIRGGTAFFIRDFGNNIATSEVWQLSDTGSRVALGSIPQADLSYEADWTSSGIGLAYLTGFEPSTGFSQLHIFQRVEEAMEEVPLPEGTPRAADPQWGPVFISNFTQVERITFTEPLFDYLDEAGSPFYSIRAQWNRVDGASGTYRITIDPPINEQASFDMEGVAVRINRMPCEITYIITVAHSTADGSPGVGSNPHTVSTPPCAARIFPVVNDLYGDAVAATQPVEQQTEAAPAQNNIEQPAATEEPAPAFEQPTQAPPAAPLEPGIEQGGAATVTAVTAATPVQEGTNAAGAPLYNVNLSWSPPEQEVNFFLVVVSPPFGANNRDRVPVRAQGDPIVAQIIGLSCGIEYTFTVQSIAGDGQSVLSNADPISVAMPFCE
ncbi:MAG TPA: hypothetical protein VJZ27_04520 [Aggregatilineales bacterium]|nr:hypothetical protein [Aggregatilineales bacterium]